MKKSVRSKVSKSESVETPLLAGQGRKPRLNLKHYLSYPPLTYSTGDHTAQPSVGFHRACGICRTKMPFCLAFWTGFLGAICLTSHEDTSLGSDQPLHWNALCLGGPLNLGNWNAWRSKLTLESMGEVGKVSPDIDTILSQENDALGKYAPSPSPARSRSVWQTRSTTASAPLPTWTKPCPSPEPPEAFRSSQARPTSDHG